MKAAGAVMFVVLLFPVTLGVFSSAAVMVEETTTAAPTAAAPVDVDVTDLPGDIPPRAAYAYVMAAESVHNTCDLEWWHLAAVGRVETNHGRHGGRSLNPVTGRMEPILWMYDVIAMGGGPMAFLGITWKWAKVDGDGDGIADVQDVDDTTAAAAALLCRGGFSQHGEAHAIGSYNAGNGFKCLGIASCVRYRNKALTYMEQLVGFYPRVGCNTPVTASTSTTATVPGGPTSTTVPESSKFCPPAPIDEAGDIPGSDAIKQ